VVKAINVITGWLPLSDDSLNNFLVTAHGRAWILSRLVKDHPQVEKQLRSAGRRAEKVK
jgi:hypothetical protein